ncbi:MAG: NFACT family protein, partial [Proteobacteria bacterium]|nr:NFACT family protein [Pseudomonadota bacterium]
MSEVEVEDYTQSPAVKVTIELDVKLGPNENIERLFKLAKKGKRTIKLANERLPEIKEELEYLNSLYFEIESAKEQKSMAALEFVTDELTKAGYIKEQRGKKNEPKKTEKRGEPIERVSREDEVVILVGKSGIGNDLIVKKHARAGDLWFHAKG